MLAIRLSPELEARLSALAKRSGRTKTFYAREALEKHLEDLEDLYDAEERLADIKSGKSKTIPIEEVMKRYGMDY